MEPAPPSIISPQIAARPPSGDGNQGGNNNSCGNSYRQISIVWPLNGGAPYLHLCDEQHGHRLLSPTDLNAVATQTEPTDAAHLREALRLLSAMAEQIENT
jgi:hypothetical protein